MTGSSPPDTGAARLRRDLAEARAQLEQAGRDHAVTRRQLQNQIHQMAQGFDSYESRLTELLRENEALRGQLAGLSPLREEIRRCHALAREDTARAEAMTARIAGLEADLAERNGEIARLECAIAGIRERRFYRLGTALHALPAPPPGKG